MSNYRGINVRSTSEAEFQQWERAAAVDERSNVDWARRVLNLISEYEIGIVDLREVLEDYKRKQQQ